MLLHTYACCARPLHVCDRQKEKGSVKSDVDASPHAATNINKCSVVTMVGTARSIEITKVSYQVQSTDACLCYQRLRISCTLCNNFQAARPRQTTERRLAPLYDKSYAIGCLTYHRRPRGVVFSAYNPGARQSMCCVRTLHARTQTRVFSLEEREVKLSPTGD